MEKIKKIIREIIEEFFLSEIQIDSNYPKNFEFYETKSNKQWQYIFTSENGFDYVFIFDKKNLNLTDSEIIDTYNANNNKELDNEIFEFLEIAFVPYVSNANDSNSYKEKTNSGKPILLMGNILALWEDFESKHSGKFNYFYAAEPKRQSLYKNLRDNMEDKFETFGPKRYDTTYDDDLVLFIVK